MPSRREFLVRVTATTATAATAAFFVEGCAKPPNPTVPPTPAVDRAATMAAGVATMDAIKAPTATANAQRTEQRRAVQLQENFGTSGLVFSDKGTEVDRIKAQIAAVNERAKSDKEFRVEIAPLPRQARFQAKVSPHMGIREIPHKAILPKGEVMLGAIRGDQSEISIQPMVPDAGNMFIVKSTGNYLGKDPRATPRESYWIVVQQPADAVAALDINGSFQTPFTTGNTRQQIRGSYALFMGERFPQGQSLADNKHWIRLEQPQK